MPFHPHEPEARHVWVMTTGEHGPPVAGIVLQWQHAPLHHAGSSPWQALVATTPFDDALVVRWVDASRLVELRNPSPAP